MVNHHRNVKGLVALVAAAAALCLNFGQAGQAQAAADGVAIPKFIDITKEAARIDQVKAELNAKIDTEIAKLQAVDTLLAELEALHAEVTTLSNDLSSSQSVAAASMDSALSLIDDGTTVFIDQVAALLSPELVAQVTEELLQARQTFTATATMSDGTTSDITDRMGGLEGSFNQFRSEVARLLQETKGLQEELIAVRKENVDL